MIILVFLREIVDRIVAVILTSFIILLVAWPFMEPGFGKGIMKPLTLLSIAGLFWVFLPAIIGTVTAAYKDWKVTKWK